MHGPQLYQEDTISRTLPGTISSALAASGAQPSLSVQINNLTGTFKLLTTNVINSQGNTVGFLTAAGTILRFITIGANQIFLNRITIATSIPQWQATGVLITTDARYSAGCAVAQTGATIRLFYYKDSTTKIVFRDSIDDGVTWSAETATNGSVLPVGTLCFGLFAPDINMVTASTAVFAGFDVAAASLYRTINSAGWGAWTLAGPTTSLWGQLRGLSSVLVAGTTYVAAGFQARTLQTGCAAGVFTELYPATPTTFSSWYTVASMDNKNLGLTYAYPSISFDVASGLFTVVAMLQDDGTASGVVQTRTGVFQSSDGLTYRLIGWIGNTLFTNACALTVAGVLYVFDPNNVYTLTSVPNVLDVTNDVLGLRISETIDAAQSIGLTLANQAGQYLGASQLAPNATITIALGYNGTTIATHTAYIDTVAQVAGAENLVCEISGRSVSKFLDQVIARALIYSNQTIAQLISALCALAGVTLDPLPGTSQFSQTLPCLMIQPGDTYATVLNRLANVYGYTKLDRGTPSVTIVEPQAADASSWSYAQETFGLAWATHADQSTLIRVIGQSTTTTPVFADITDDTAILVSGGERYRHIVDRNLNTAAKARLRAQLALREEQQQAGTGTLTVSLNPTHELMDVVTVTDARIGLSAQHMRIIGLDWHIDMQSGEWLQHLHVQLP